MTSDRFVTSDGGVLWRPDERTHSEVRARGAHVVENGWLCTTCLTGTWPRTLQRFTQYVCDACLALDVMLTTRTAAPTRAIALTEVQREAALAYRSRRLARVFTLAAESGATLVETGTAGRRLQALSWSDYAAFVRPTDDERVRRFAQWLQAVAPEAFEPRTSALADPAGLGRYLSDREQAVRVTPARQALESTLRGVRSLPRRLTRDVVTLATAHTTPKDS